MAKKHLSLIFAFGTALNALGFAPMGNVSTSLGGSGVALRNSAWGLYYNPALLSSDPRSKFSFSGGFYLSQSGINELLESTGKYNQVEQILNNLQDSKISVETQLGVVAQIGGFIRQEVRAVEDEYGRLVSEVIEHQMSAFAIGAFASSLTNISLSSAGGTQYQASSFGIALLEVPVGYAYKLETDFGDFNFGVAMKYMRAVFDSSSYRGSGMGELKIEIPDFMSMSPAQNFGLDLGFLYSIYDVHLGLTAKNINLPSFKIHGERITLDPQLRFGVSYEFLKNYVVTMDIDLLSYDSYSAVAPKSQYFGLGIMGDYGFLDFRVGVSMDMLGVDGAKISAGFNAFGIIDVVGEMGTNFAKKNGSKLAVPTNFGVKIGSTFTF